ncbi:hypothetical protein F511_46440 [Dorcoceras hygrometricum]|uniref:Uncharacterized protein n=1 Tax=Dorcoceras hygrometricum TaxID=472368 RepID=A0A2Z6ZTJ4_9LAMI|nr:hypothetical protein F511_46440 [Dorcoceras hygrometricum]
MEMNRMFKYWTGPAPGPMGRFKPIIPILSLDLGQLMMISSHNPSLQAPKTAAPLLSNLTHGRRPPPRLRRAAAIRLSCDQTCFDHRDEEIPSMAKSVRSSSADLRRKIDSGRGPD